METSKHDHRLVMLTDILILKKKLNKLGWGFCCIAQDANRGAIYRLVKFDTSRRRLKIDIELEFTNIDLAWGLVVLIESGLKETVILGELDYSPSLDAYFEMVRRLDVHGCRLSGEIDIDRMSIGYRISINKQNLLFNQWEAVNELVNYLDKGNSTKASVSKKTDQLTTMKEAKR